LAISNLKSLFFFKLIYQVKPDLIILIFSIFLDLNFEISAYFFLKKYIPKMMCF